jgi:hypothetical protein
MKFPVARYRACRALTGLLLLLLLAGCAADGGTANPLVRPFQYFSYANGEDIRDRCRPGTASRYRLIFNALYEQQVRSYDIVQAVNGRVGEQETRVFARGIGGEAEIGADGVKFKSDFHSVETITYHDLLDLDRALIDSGFEQPSREGLVLHSDEFYWIAMVCRDGVFKYNAWTKETSDIAGLPFLDVLLRGDSTGADVPPVKEPTMHIRGGRPRGGKYSDSLGYFSLQLDSNGLRL